MIRPARIRPIRIHLAGSAVLLMLGLDGAAALAQDPAGIAPYRGLLAEPGDYNFAPPALAPSALTPPALARGGVASATYGSRNLSAASIRMDSGLIGNTGTRAFVALQAAHEPVWLGRPDGSTSAVVSQGAEIGVEKAFADGTEISLEGGWQHDRLQLDHPRQATLDPVPVP